MHGSIQRQAKFSGRSDEEASPHVEFVRHLVQKLSSCDILLIKLVLASLSN
jgi:hypothetical protein